MANAENNSFDSVLIVGTGLIGTSIAMSLVAHGKTVYLDDSDSVQLDTAVTRSHASKWDHATQVDLVVIATPPSVVASAIRSIVELVPSAAITDVASVKGVIFDALVDLDEATQARIVGGHPMAGREVSGAVAAQDKLFVDRSWVITPRPVNSDAAVARVETLVRELGAVPVIRSVEEHDRAVALVSHAPQVVASVLASQLNNAEQHDIDLAGSGIRDTIRIAGSDPKLWTEILAGNSANVVSVLRQVASDLGKAAQSLEVQSADGVREFLAAGNSGRSRLPGKHGSEQTADRTLIVRVEDKPGELARLFSEAAAAQVNLEDVRIDHSMGRMTGLVELTVAASSADTLIGALTSHGFEVIG